MCSCLNKRSLFPVYSTTYSLKLRFFQSCRVECVSLPTLLICIFQCWLKAEIEVFPGRIVMSGSRCVYASVCSSSSSKLECVYKIQNNLSTNSILLQICTKTEINPEPIEIFLNYFVLSSTNCLPTL